MGADFTCSFQDSEACKGWYYPDGYFVSLDWSAEEREKDYHTYLLAFAHEQFHYLQFVGTSFGQFLCDLDEIWVTETFETIRFGLQRSTSVQFPLARRIANEQSNDLKKRLEYCLKLRTVCRELRKTSTNGGTTSDFNR